MELLGNEWTRPNLADFALVNPFRHFQIGSSPFPSGLWRDGNIVSRQNFQNIIFPPSEVRERFARFKPTGDVSN